MTSAAEKPRRATAADVETWTRSKYVEVIGGELVEKAAPSGDHANTQAGLVEHLRARFHRDRGGGDRPGGWWILTEATIELETHEVYQPDVSGWRRARVAERPRGMPVRVPPDWVCEILSPSNARYDLVDKLRVYQRHGIPHYGIIDAAAETLTVYRLLDGAYSIAQVARRGERVRPEPFDEVELAVGVLFGDDAAG
jgi:Uma2 family endonuclease